MDEEERRENETFENEVRRIARELWPSAAYSGAAIVDGKERDGIFETEECIHLVEATTSRKKDKAQEDVGKLYTLASKIQKSNARKAVKCWFVTRDEPTPDQRGVAEKRGSLVIALSSERNVSMTLRHLLSEFSVLLPRSQWPELVC